MSDRRPGGPRRPPRPSAASDAGRTTSTRKPPAKKAATKKSAPKKAASKKAATKKSVAPRKTPAKKAPVKKAPSARRPSPQPPGPRGPRRTPVRRAPAKSATSSVRFRDLPTGEVATARAREGAAPAPVADRPEPPTPKVRRDWTGRVRAVRPDPAEILPPPPTPATAFRQRYGVVYDTHGPRMRLGVLWCIAVALSLAFEPIRPYGLALVTGIMAGVAARQVIDAWHPDRGGADRLVAGLGAATLPVLATNGTRLLGAGLLALVVASLVVALIRPKDARDVPLFAAAGLPVLSAGVCGGAAAALVLLANYEIGAVIILVIFLFVYDASDYVVGSGATNGVEGPLAGALFIFATTMLLAFTEVPPFRGVDVWNFAMLAAVGCPAGQLLASAMLPRANAKAPALRRLDSMLVAAPAWAGLIGLYLQSAGHQG